MIDPGRYTSGAIATANLSASIESMELRRIQRATIENLTTLSKLLFLRGDLFGRIGDHNRAELVANEGISLSSDTTSALFVRAQLAERFHRFDEANTLVERARVAGHPLREVDALRAALLQATGSYDEALVLRQRLAKDHPGIDTLGALASLLAEIGEWPDADTCYTTAIDADDGVSPFPCSQVLFEWGVSAMRRGDLDRAETILAQLAVIMPAHVPGRGHRAEVALARGRLDAATALIRPLLEMSDDPEYRATYAEILAARGDREAATEARRAAAAYEALLAGRPEAYADHAAAFYLGVGNRPERAAELALANWKLRDTPRSRRLLARARQTAQQASALGPFVQIPRDHFGTTEARS